MKVTIEKFADTLVLIGIVFAFLDSWKTGMAFCFVTIGVGLFNAIRQHVAQTEYMRTFGHRTGQQVVDAEETKG